MSAFTPESSAVLELIVSNHPGVLLHVCSLFSRRAYNVEGVLCMPCDGGEQSRIWLRVKEDRRLDQIVKHLHNLEDVRSVRRQGVNDQARLQVGKFFSYGGAFLGEQGR